MFFPFKSSTRGGIGDTQEGISNVFVGSMGKGHDVHGPLPWPAAHRMRLWASQGHSSGFTPAVDYCMFWRRFQFLTVRGGNQMNEGETQYCANVNE